MRYEGFVSKQTGAMNLRVCPSNASTVNSNRSTMLLVDSPHAHVALMEAPY